MADDITQRYRSNDPHGRGAPDPHGRTPAGSAPAGRAPSSDPLAELARLIGQNDPFAEFGRDAGRAPRQQPPQHADWSAPAAPRDPRQQPPPYQQPASYQPQEPSGGYPDDRGYYGAPQSGAADQPYVDDRHDNRQQAYGGNQQPYADNQQPYGSPPVAGQDQFPPAYNPQPYAQNAQDGRGYQADPYHREYGHVPESGEETYDDAPRGRRSGLKVVLAVAALAILGTAGAFAFRAVYGNSTPGSLPPVIMANPAPNKVVPTAPSGGDSQANKLIYDRIGDRSQDEKVVSREEQPVDMKPSAPARVVFPNAANAPSTSASPAASGSNEPKKVKTIPIRPDQPEGRASAAAPARAANPAAVGSASAPPAAPRTPVAANPPPPAPPASSTAPLSLNPQTARNDQAPAPAPAVRTAAASPPSARPVAPTAGDGSGAYHVQVSSQRSESDAQASFRALQSKFPNVLGSRQAVVRRADLGDKGVYYRAMIGPFATMTEASDLCGELKSAGGQCIVQRN
jgi:hypothetical protein